MWCKVQLVRFRKTPLEIEPWIKEHCCLKAILDSEENSRHGGSPTTALVGKLTVIDVRPGFQVIDRPTQIFRPRDNVIAIQAACVGEGVLQCISSLEGRFVNGKHDRSPASEDELESIRGSKVCAGSRTNGAGTWEVHHSLVGRGPSDRQEEIRRHPLIPISGSERNLLAFPLPILFSGLHHSIEGSFVVGIKT